MSNKHFNWLDDEWERFTVCFSMYFPTKTNEYMRINGDLPELGAWNKGDGPVRMKYGEERIWLTGQKVKPWEFLLKVKSSTFTGRLVYKYSIMNDSSQYTIWEREPSRMLVSQNPSDYIG